MVIKRSASTEIRQLVDALASGDDVRREAAVARLAIVGSRAVDRLVAAYAAAADGETRIAVLRALESLADPRTVPVARKAIARGGDEAIAGAAALRALLDSPHAPSASAALDLLVAAALDAANERRLRLAAVDALQDLPHTIRDRVAEALKGDRALDATGAEALWADALEGHLPDDPRALREALLSRASAAKLTSLRALIDAVRTREGALDDGTRREEWRALRGALHQAIALRGSRIALYDLRESVEQGNGALPAGFAAALHTVGDASCLPPLAAAYARTGDDASRRQLRGAFRAIVKRDGITKRHPAMKRIAAKWPEILDQ